MTPQASRSHLGGYVLDVHFHPVTRQPKADVCARDVAMRQVGALRCLEHGHFDVRGLLQERQRIVHGPRGLPVAIGRAVPELCLDAMSAPRMLSCINAARRAVPTLEHMSKILVVTCSFTGTGARLTELLCRSRNRTSAQVSPGSRLERWGAALRAVA
ncbi:hypothetical protein ASC95_01475 [Pelomonas sp. Root1217]|nr:hypothetical protein ASC95_01475 [Pelomonas sp. Root1217]